MFFYMYKKILTFYYCENLVCLQCIKKCDNLLISYFTQFLWQIIQSISNVTGILFINGPCIKYHIEYCIYIHLLKLLQNNSVSLKPNKKNYEVTNSKY